MGMRCRRSDECTHRHGHRVLAETVKVEQAIERGGDQRRRAGKPNLRTRHSLSRSPLSLPHA
eukprot:6189949-Pleurochrysis_carterae.AAC.1